MPKSSNRTRKTAKRSVKRRGHAPPSGQKRVEVWLPEPLSDRLDDALKQNANCKRASYIRTAIEEKVTRDEQRKGACLPSP